ncbi:MAG: hypothetical protein HON70_22710, partial [Lentisphaerae bacterium]|nr:hypothetical protein [Lentisphaerota bacterium]
MPERKQILCAALASWAALLYAAHADILRYDMGTPDSAVAEDWTRLTADDIYTEQSGIGWVVQSPGVRPKPKLYARDENFSSQTDFLKLGPVLRDHVIAGRNYFSYASGPYAFRMNLEPGKYVGTVIMLVMTEKTACTINRPPFWWRDYTVAINGDPIAKITRGDIKQQLNARGAVSETDFLPGRSLFERGVRPHLAVHTFQFEGPVLELTMNAFCPVNALLIAPAAEKMALDDAVTALLGTENSFVDRQFTESRKEDVIDETARTAGQRAGALLFSRPMRPLGPHSRPGDGESGRPVGDFVSPGETGILRFGLLPMKALRKVEITLADFRGPAGQVLPSRIGSTWLSRLVPVRTVRTGDYYAVRPAYAFPYAAQDLPDG